VFLQVKGIPSPVENEKAESDKKLRLRHLHAILIASKVAILAGYLQILCRGVPAGIV
jgi:hypothetical protein